MSYEAFHVNAWSVVDAVARGVETILRDGVPQNAHPDVADLVLKTTTAVVSCIVEELDKDSPEFGWRERVSETMSSRVSELTIK